MIESIQWFVIAAMCFLMVLVCDYCEKLERRIDNLERKGGGK
jgi:hypothetical protein